MPASLSDEHLQPSFALLKEANALFARVYPGDTETRQPVHTVYGGAQIFKADTAHKLGTTALASIQEYASPASTFARAMGLTGSPALQKMIFRRVWDKLSTEPVEDFRIDFEDGYGNRSDGEEDGHAASTAAEVAAGMAAGTLPPYIGIRIKPFTEDLKRRSVRTLDVFMSTLVEATDGALPPNFVVTLPKVVMPQQIEALVEVFRLLEAKLGLPSGALKMEFMVETPQSIFNMKGETAIPAFVAAAGGPAPSGGRCVAAHFGVYDYTASITITAEYQTMVHPACDFARSVMKTTLAGTGVWISDGATNVMPVGPHRPSPGKRLTPRQRAENRKVVHRVMKLNVAHINHSLMNGFYQGWDLHPAQLPVRYAAVYHFFLRNLEATSMRLRTFVEKAARATLIGEVFDDAATGQGLLNFFLQGIGCGAITEEEAQKTGLTVEEIRMRSFVRILQSRRTTRTKE